MAVYWTGVEGHTQFYSAYSLINISVCNNNQYATFIFNWIVVVNQVIV